MFVLLSIIFCCFVYLISVKLLYNRFKKLWPVLLNNVSLSPCTKKDLNVLSTYDRYDFNSRNSEKDNLHTLNDNRVLIVTAHPDDECMFFAPTILKLVESNALVHLLCLSSGNYCNQGDQRKKELVDSCAVLGIPANRVTIIDNNVCQGHSGSGLVDEGLSRGWFSEHAIILSHHTGPAPDNSFHAMCTLRLDSSEAVLAASALPVLRTRIGSPPSGHGILGAGVEGAEGARAGAGRELPDDPKADWSTALISALILTHIRAHAIHLVLTFDEGGVSGHVNHIAIHKAFRYLVSVGRIPEDCQVLCLHTISIFRKYLSVLELPISWFLPSSFYCVIGPEEYRRAKGTLAGSQDSTDGRMFSPGLRGVPAMSPSYFFSSSFLPSFLLAFWRQEAMLRHRSQLLWFRRLYLLFSRYMFINTFRAITVETKNVKIY
ncbi:hypothetical protein P4O66_016339 [Electrophorus voltai]|uniref:N-acetylglucosaminylphosphatidylinositol deacetylase n=1 Tax=Electrophorus voltai TaxID=2609070 RepID=A0AAD9DQ78_9TELE|nr:hypothetical protein P4O66_016339 [Electrophorus voltai]